MSKPLMIVAARSVYGVVKYYPVCQVAQTLVSINESKTLSKRHFDAAVKLGYRIEVRDGEKLDQWLEDLVGAA